MKGFIQFPVFNPYIKSTCEIYISGCTRKCKECHNPELWDFNYGEELNIEELIKYLKDREDLFDIISITGGDLLEQNINEAADFIQKLNEIFKYKQFWLFTGYELKNLQQDKFDWVFIFFDYIKIGCYQKELKQEGFPASSNQKLLIKGKDY